MKTASGIEIPTPIERSNIVLGALYDNSKEKVNTGIVIEWLKEKGYTDEEEVKRILVKLAKDDYICKDVTEHQITHNGVLFHLFGGYIRQYEVQMLEIQQEILDRDYNITRDTTLSQLSRNLNCATWAIVFATLVLALVEIGKSYHWFGLHE